MNIGITGPTSISKVCDILGIDEEKYFMKLRKVAEHLAASEHKIFIVPFKKSAPEFVAEVYAEEDGSDITGIVPEDDVDFGITHLNRAVCDKIVNCSIWPNVPGSLLKNIDVLVVVGFGRNAFIHIGYTSLYKVKKVIILQDLVSSKLPNEMEAGLEIQYVKSEDLHKAL